MIDFDTQDKYPLPSVRAWLRERTAGWDWHEWAAIAWCLLTVAATAMLVFMAGCASNLASQAKGRVSGATSGAVACGQSWWQQIAGLGVLNWMGGLLILAGGIAFVGAFVPAVGALFPKKMAVSCVIAGIASILLYNFLTEYLWAVYLTLAAGGLLALLSYRHWLWERIVWLAELIVQKDLDKSGGIGPKSGAD